MDMIKYCEKCNQDTEWVSIYEDSGVEIFECTHCGNVNGKFEAWWIKKKENEKNYKKTKR